MSLLLDAGALIAYERASRSVLGHLKVASAARAPIKTSTAVIAQVWRHGAKQAGLAMLLRAVDEVALTPSRAREAGLLLARARTSDVVDAALVQLAEDGDEILTSDPHDLRALAAASGKLIVITHVS